MADKDIGIGWGDLNGSLTEWYCLVCDKNHAVAAWQVVKASIKGVSMDGRKCPSCEFTVYEYGETSKMAPK